MRGVCVSMSEGCLYESMREGCLYEGERGVFVV